MSAIALRLKELRSSEQRGRELLVSLGLVLVAYLLGQRLPYAWPLIFAGLGGAIGLMVMLRNPLAALVGVLFLSSVHYAVKAVIFQWHPSAVILKDGLLMLLFGFWCLNVIIREGGIVKTPLTLPLLAFVAVVSLQIFNPNTYGVVASLDDYRFWIGQLVIFLLTTHLIKTRRGFELALRAVFGYALVLAIYGCVQPLLPRELLVRLGADPESYWFFFQGSIRAFSTMGTGQFALFAAMFAPLAFFYMSQQREPFRRFLLGLAGFVFILGSVLTLVRAGWVAAAAALVAYAIFTRRLWIVVLLLSVGIVLTTFAEGYMRQKVEGLLNPQEDPSVQTRLEIARVLSDAVAFRVFGYGLGTFAHNRFAREAGYRDKTGYGVATENFFIMLALEMGWVGLVIFLWVLYKIYALGWRQFKRLKTRRYRELSIGLLASMIALDVARNAGPAGYYPPEAWHYWFFVGLLVLIPRFDEELAAEDQPPASAPGSEQLAA